MAFSSPPCGQLFPADNAELLEPADLRAAHVLFIHVRLDSTPGMTLGRAPSAMGGGHRADRTAAAAAAPPVRLDCSAGGTEKRSRAVNALITQSLPY